MWGNNGTIMCAHTHTQLNAMAVITSTLYSKCASYVCTEIEWDEVIMRPHAECHTYCSFRTRTHTYTNAQRRIVFCSYVNDLVRSLDKWNQFLLRLLLRNIRKTTFQQDLIFFARFWRKGNRLMNTQIGVEHTKKPLLLCMWYLAFLLSFSLAFEKSAVKNFSFHLCNWQKLNAQLIFILSFSPFFVFLYAFLTVIQLTIKWSACGHASQFDGPTSNLIFRIKIHDWWICSHFVTDKCLPLPILRQQLLVALCAT